MKRLLILSMLLLALVVPVKAQSSGMWIGAAELAALPTSGAAWNAVKQAAGASCTPDLSNQDDNCDQVIYAAALVYAKTGEVQYREKVLKALAAVPETENGGRTLALARNLLPYVIAADLVQLDGEQDAAFRAWLSKVRTETLDGRTLISTHEDRPNNWGTHAGASRIAADLYLGDTADLDRAAKVYRGWAGERNAYAGFSYGELDWQCNPAAPVGVNPAGCTVQGVDVGGSQPEEMRRAGAFSDPPRETGYAWEALQGAVAQVWLLERAGYDAAEYGDRALLRAVQYLYRIGWVPTGDDTWQPWVINELYGTTFSTTSPTTPGKNIGFADWTHSGAAVPDSTSTLKPATTTPKTATPSPVFTVTSLPTATVTVQAPTAPPAPGAPIVLICEVQQPGAAVRSTGLDIAAEAPAPRWPVFLAGLGIGGVLTLLALAWLYYKP